MQSCWTILFRYSLFVLYNYQELCRRLTVLSELTQATAIHPVSWHTQQSLVICLLADKSIFDYSLFLGYFFLYEMFILHVDEITENITQLPLPWHEYIYAYVSFFALYTVSQIYVSEITNTTAVNICMFSPKGRCGEISSLRNYYSVYSQR